MATAPFTMQPQLTAIAIAYRNPDAALIADEVLPRVKPVSQREFSYTKHDLSAFNRPSTLVGRKGRPNEVGSASDLLAATVEDYGLEEPIPQDDIDQGRTIGRNLAAEATEYIMGLLRLDRECRVAALVQSADNYASANTETLTGAAQWSHADSKPLSALLEALDTPMVRPNLIVLSAPVWAVLRCHPQIVRALYPISAEGVVTRQQVADMLEVKAVLVGASRVNTARKGQAAALARTWGNHCAMLHIDPSAATQRGITWGMTVPYGTPVAGTRVDPDIGLRGGIRVRAGESLRELVTAPDAGCLLKNCIAAA